VAADAVVVVDAATAAAAAEQPMTDAAIDGETTIRSAGSADLPAIAALLAELRLPLAGVEEHLGGFLVAERGGRLIGCAGIERHGDSALLRSVAVASPERGRGLGARLVAACLGRAREDGLRTISLLTETAESFFPRFGFVPIARAELPPALGASQELQGACPESARAMTLALSP
jgi:amino-acid N-acetyltransferase